MNITQFRELCPELDTWLANARKDSAPSDFPWYPYGSLSNFIHLDRLLSGENRDLASLANGQKIVDIGAADGDTAFALARQGFRVDIVDHGPTNMNGLRGARLLKQHLNLDVGIHDVDLDSQFQLPEENYGLAFFLGILYHLKNPYLVLENLAKRARFALVSTRIARFMPKETSGANVENTPLAYLLDTGEANGDATNYWIFSDAGLKRIFNRTGWDIVEYMTVGDVNASNPMDGDHDERAFALLRSRNF
jgi:tRNA (mo5U34)-methyltransferase